MPRTIHAFFVAAALCAALVPLGVTAAVPTPRPTPAGTMPPEIEHTYTHPVCSALRTKFGPAIAMMQQNDKEIAKGTPVFADYALATKAKRNIDLLRLENLVSPLADNIIAIQKLLTDDSVFPPVARTEDDQRKLVLRKQLLQSLANQEAALDIINGFVDTQDLASMQHEGFENLGAILGPDVKTSTTQGLTDLTGPTPDPLHPENGDNTLLRAGLAPNPYGFNPTQIPGLALGFNPIGKLKQGLEWTQTESKKSEARLADTVEHTVDYCRSVQSPPSPKP